MKLGVIFSRVYEVEIDDNISSEAIEDTAKGIAYRELSNDMEIGAACPNEDDFSAKIEPINRIEYAIKTKKSKDAFIQMYLDDFEMGLFTKTEIVCLISSRLIINNCEREYIKQYVPDK